MLLFWRSSARGLHQRLQRGQLGMDAQRDRVRVGRRVLEGVGGVDLRLELDRLDRRAPEAQGLGTVTVLAGGLDLDGPAQRVGVVLQGKDPQHGRGPRVDLHETAPEQSGGEGHRSSSIGGSNRSPRSSWRHW